MDEINADLERARADLAYWGSVRQQQVAAGEVVEYGPSTVSSGDQVKIRGQWRLVVRANAKSITVTTGHSRSDRGPPSARQP